MQPCFVESGVNSKPAANGPCWNDPAPARKQNVLFDPRAPGTIVRSRLGIRKIEISRHAGLTDMPLPFAMTLPFASKSMSPPGRIPSALDDRATVGPPSASCRMIRKTSGMNVSGAASSRRLVIISSSDAGNHNTIWRCQIGHLTNQPG